MIVSMPPATGFTVTCNADLMAFLSKHPGGSGLKTVSEWIKKIYEIDNLVAGHRLCLHHRPRLYRLRAVQSPLAHN